MKSFTSLIFLATLTSFTTTCKLRNTADQSNLTTTGEDLPLCIALRGNGHYLSTHFGAMARIVERYGMVQGMSGGSSSTISMFIYDSIYQNPILTGLSDDRKRKYTSLLLKSTLGFMEGRKGSLEIEAMNFLKNVIISQTITAALEAPESEWESSAKTIGQELASSRFVRLINPIVLDILAGRDLHGFSSRELAAKEVLVSLREFGNFTATDQKIFFRDGLINFTEFAHSISRTADFYTGSHVPSRNPLKFFLEQCADKIDTTGKTWEEIAQTPTPSGKSCSSIFTDAVQHFFTSLPQGYLPFRGKETVGSKLMTIVSTSVLANANGIEKFNEAYARFLTGEKPNLSIDFNDVSLGYWVPSRLATRIAKGTKEMADMKSKKFFSLGSAGTWEKALATSPAEPGLSKFVPIDQNTISLGGWSDLHPVQVLKAAGCQKIVYVTRRDQESSFLIDSRPIDGIRPAQGVAELLNITESQRQGIYSFGSTSSGFNAALRLANAVWCTNWNAFSSDQTSEMMNESYASEVFSKDTFFTDPTNDKNKIVNGPIAGCSPSP